MVIILLIIFFAMRDFNYCSNLEFQIVANLTNERGAVVSVFLGGQVSLNVTRRNDKTYL